MYLIKKETNETHTFKMKTIFSVSQLKVNNMTNGNGGYLYMFLVGLLFLFQ